MIEMLKPRDIFRESVFKRDNYKCVVCGEPAQDAHHIIERRLFDDGGYDVENGASLCGFHHIEAEKITLDAQELRDFAGIKKIVLPKAYHRDTRYDKWGNIILPNGQRMKGELFYDTSVQKILSEVLCLFTDYVKYPRTKHFPWSESVGRDDDILSDFSVFDGKLVVVTEKMDGENASVYSDGYFHARSVSGNEHPSQSWLKNFIQKFCFDIPKAWRVCGENLYARHSVSYDALESYFQVFSIWNDRNECLEWKETLEYCELLGLTHVPVLWQGVFDRDEIRKAFLDSRNTETSEGYVVRSEERFHYTDFQTSVAKYVRADHITEERHNWRMRWNSSGVNKLAGKKS